MPRAATLKIPDGTTLHVGPWRYTVQYRPHLKDEGKEVSGLCAARSRKLWINPDACDEFTFETVLHELHHGWKFSLGWPLDDEGQCDRFAAEAAQLISDLVEQRILILPAAGDTETKPGTSDMMNATTIYHGQQERRIAAKAAAVDFERMLNDETLELRRIITDQRRELTKLRCQLRAAGGGSAVPS